MPAEHISNVIRKVVDSIPNANKKVYKGCTGIVEAVSYEEPNPASFELTKCEAGDCGTCSLEQAANFLRKRNKQSTQTLFLADSCKRHPDIAPGQVDHNNLLKRIAK